MLFDLRRANRMRPHPDFAECSERRSARRGTLKPHAAQADEPAVTAALGGWLDGNDSFGRHGATAQSSGVWPRVPEPITTPHCRKGHRCAVVGRLDAVVPGTRPIELCCQSMDGTRRDRQVAVFGVADRCPPFDCARIASSRKKSAFPSCLGGTPWG